MSGVTAETKRYELLRAIENAKRELWEISMDETVSAAIKEGLLTQSRAGYRVQFATVVKDIKNLLPTETDTDAKERCEQAVRLGKHVLDTMDDWQFSKTNPKMPVIELPEV